MTTKSDLFIVVEDFNNKFDAQYLSVSKGDVVKVIRKEFLYYTVDKNGSIGKVP
ncbi:MAG: hypothetical protein EZS28_010136, partial [Streblomastix strix]